MKQDFTALPGVSLLYKALPNAEPIRGIVIDNPTGGWLWIVSENQWVPPYTNGWAMPLTYMQSSFNVEYRNVGPAGQVSTQQGTTDSPWRLELNSEPQDYSSGGPTSAFVEQFTGSFYIFGFVTAAWASSPAIGSAVAAVPNKRIRVRTISVVSATAGTKGLGGGDGSTIIFSQTPIDIVFLESLTTNVFYRQTVTQELPSLHTTYPQGLDLSVSNGITYNIFPYFATGTVHYVITYELI